MNGSLIAWLRHASRVNVGITFVVILTFTSLVLSPSLVAARQIWDQGLPKAAAAQGPSVAAQFAKTVLKLKQRLEHISDRLEGDGGPPDWVVFKQLRRELDRLDREVRQNFDKLEDRIQRMALPAQILNRHLTAVDRYRTGFEQLTERLIAIEAATDQTALQDAVSAAIVFLDSLQTTSSVQPFDPAKLPFGALEPTPLDPAGTGKALKARFTGSGVEPEKGTFFAGAKAAPTPADLAETEDAQITPAIEVLAVELDHDPVAIYNWVRNHVVYLPSYGSIQGSAQTLATRQGNAFDTASLLIALLRASDIPARYAYGTVTVPADQVMNWVGGVDVPEAAMSLLGQGGIPNVGLSQNGVITHIRFEHVWVEAWVDFEPSRGAIQVTGDTWVSLDASFKQYDYQAGMDIAGAVPFDALGFAERLESAAVVNEAEGWVQGVDQSLIEAELSAYQAEVEDYINTQDPQATVGEVLGSREIIPQTLPELPSSLPYAVEARTDAFSTLPDGLRWQFRYQLQDRFGGEVFTFQASLPALSGKRLALSFKPASEADQEVIESYLPEPPPDGSGIDPEDLPDSLPGYLIHVVPEWSVDGEVMATGGEFALGEELRRETGLKPPNGAWRTRTKYLVAGEYQAIGLDGQGLPADRLANLQADLEAVKAQLEAQDFAGLTKHDLTGNLLQTGILSWFALNDVQNRIAAKVAGVITHRLPSFGAFQLNLKTHYAFGIPREVSFPGVLMDIGYSRLQIAAYDNSQDKFIAFNRAAGARASANEHAVPEQLFSTPGNPVEGVSAVKALAIAAAQGQRIYTITGANLATALNALTLHPATEQDIQSAVNAGLQVTTHQHPISYHGFNGAGYIILDLQTGSGAYKISGGADGGTLFDTLGDLLLWLGTVLGAASELLQSLLLGLLEKVFALLGLAIDFAKLIAECDIFKTAIGLLSSVLVSAGIATLIIATFAWIPIALGSILAVIVLTAAASIIAGVIGGRIVNGFVESCSA